MEKKGTALATVHETENAGLAGKKPWQISAYETFLECPSIS